MERFVRVRMVQANGMDLGLFQFDYDLTFAAFFLNADRTIYGRYGTRSDQKDAMRNMSVEGFRKALEAALALHEGYPANRASLTSKTGPPASVRVPEEYPSLTRFSDRLDYAGKVAASCMHCHMVAAAPRKQLRTAGRPMPPEVIYPWPMPDTLGLPLDPQAKARVLEVPPGSQAAKDGFRAGDEILTLEGTPIISIADVQWVLHRTRPPAGLAAVVRRGDREFKLTLHLAEGWRTAGDISWRVTTWDLRRMATGGMVLEDLPDADRRKAGLADDALALWVKGVGRRSHGKRAGFKKGDVIVEFDGRTARWSESDLIAWVLQQRFPGTKLALTVLRGRKRVSLSLPMR